MRRVGKCTCLIMIIVDADALVLFTTFFTTSGVPYSHSLPCQPVSIFVRSEALVTCTNIANVIKVAI